MKTVIFFAILVAFVGLSVGHPQSDSSSKCTKEEKQIFDDWCKKFNKQYKSSQEEDEACRNVLKNKKEVDEHNKRYDSGEESFGLDLWKHSDLSEEDQEKYLHGHDEEEEDPSTRSTRAPKIPHFPEGPASIDWTERGLVGIVGDQGHCGSCWAFSVVGVVEAVLRRKNITAHASPQQLVDCHHHHARGCSGGAPAAGVNYVKKHGITSEANYPYVAHNQTSCHYKPSEKIGSVDQVFEFHLHGNETLLRDIVADVGPISISICTERSFHHYKHGVYYKKDCCTKNNHGPLLTGYGTDPKHGDYWIVKNSWGPGWGEGGYIRMARNRGNMCNIAHHAIVSST